MGRSRRLGGVASSPSSLRTASARGACVVPVNDGDRNNNNNIIIIINIAYYSSGWHGTRQPQGE